MAQPATLRKRLRRSNLVRRNLQRTHRITSALYQKVQYLEHVLTATAVAVDAIHSVLSEEQKAQVNAILDKAKQEPATDAQGSSDPVGPGPALDPPGADPGPV